MDANKAKNPKKMSNSSPAPNGAASSPAAPSSTVGKSFKGDKSKRKNTTDGVDTNRTDSKVRNGAITLFYNGIAFMSEEAPDKVLAKAVEVEKALLDAHGGETDEYKKKTRALFANLKHAKNRDLGPRVFSGQIPAARFVIMTDDELKSAEMKETDAKLSKENMKMAQVPMAEKSISDALKCGKCGQKKVSYSQAQTRSADEPMTTFCECTVCGNRWKVSHDAFILQMSNLVLIIYSSLDLVCHTQVASDIPSAPFTSSCSLQSFYGWFLCYAYQRGVGLLYAFEQFICDIA